MQRKWLVHSHHRIKCHSNLLQLEPCDVILKVISDIMGHWYDLWNTIVIEINFFIANYLSWAICLSNLLQLEHYNVMFNVILT